MSFGRINRSWNGEEYFKKVLNAVKTQFQNSVLLVCGLEMSFHILDVPDSFNRGTNDLSVTT